MIISILIISNIKLNYYHYKGEKLYNELRKRAIKECNLNDNSEMFVLRDMMTVHPLIALKLKELSDKEFEELLK